HDIACKNAPAFDEVGIRQELHRRRELKESERTLERDHPFATARKAAERFWNEREYQEWERKHGGKHEQAERRPLPIALRRRNEQSADKGRGAGEGRQRERRSHQQ